jgi:hypothetical protein
MKLNKDINGRPIDPEFYALYMQWAGNLKGLLTVMMRRRAHEAQEAGV